MSNKSSQESSQFQIEDSSQEDQIRLHTHKSTLQVILQKARNIVPFLNRQQLIIKFKNYYENESLFFDHLDRLAKTNANNDENAFDGWINNNIDKKKAQKLIRKKSSEIQDIIKQKYEHYNFLEDQKILKKIAQQQKNGNNYKYETNQPSQRKYKSKNNHIQVKKKSQIRQQRLQQNRNKKLKIRYVSKQKQQKNNNNSSLKIKRNSYYVEKKQNQQPKQNKNTSLRYQRNYNHNTKSKYVQKSNKQTKYNGRYRQKIEQNQLTNYQNKEDNLVKNKQISNIEFDISNRQIQQKSEINKIQNNSNIQNKISDSKIQQKTNINQQISKIIKQNPNQQQIAKKIEKQNKIVIQQKNVLTSEQIEKRFQKTCNQNAYVLKYIKPIEKIQKIQYTMTRELVSNIKVRVLANIS